MIDEAKPDETTMIEEIKVSGHNLVDKVKALAAEGGVRQLRIVADDGDVFLRTPLNVGLVVGGVVILAAPWLAILGAIAALVSEVKIEVERVAKPAEPVAQAEPEHQAG